jgi:predicted dehydrogenase
LDWDLWLGPAPARPYHPAYHPWTWRNWRDFGTGLLGDLGLHKLSTVFKALKLDHPVSVEGSATKFSPETYPLGEIVKFEFPARGQLAPVTLSWYDGGLKPFRPPEFDDDDVLQDVLYIGDEGKLMNNRLIPDLRMETYKLPPKTLPRSPGQYQEWVNACGGGRPAGSNFVDHAALVTEVCLLGNIAVRREKKLLWDAVNLQFKNDPAATKLLRREYREGWAL